MGLILYAVLMFYGFRGVPLKRGSTCCVITAALLTPLGIAGSDSWPTCNGWWCYTSVTVGIITLTFLMTLAFAFASLAVGYGGRKLIAHLNRA